MLKEIIEESSTMYKNDYTCNISDFIIPYKYNAKLWREILNFLIFKFCFPWLPFTPELITKYIPFGIFW